MTTQNDVPVRLLEREARSRRDCLSRSRRDFLSGCLSGWAVAIGLAVALAVTTFPKGGGGGGDPSSTCVADLPARIEHILAASSAASSAYWGVHISSDRLGELVSINANASFVPASNNKLLTASAALKLRGEQFRFVTNASLANAFGGNATLCISPGGDPSLDDDALVNLLARLRSSWSSLGSNFTALALAATPVPPPSSWEYGDLGEYYGALPEPTIVNQNSVTLRVAPGSVQGSPLSISLEDHADAPSFQLINHAVTSAAAAAATAAAAAPPPLEFHYELDPWTLALQLRASGSMSVSAASRNMTFAARAPIALFASHVRSAAAAAGLGELQGWGQAGGGSGGSGGSSSAAAAAAELVDRCDDPEQRSDEELARAVVSSSPAVELLNKTLLESNNLYAEAFLRALGDDGSAAAGLAAVRSALGSIGLPQTSGWVMVDGSGLSRHNLVAPRLLVSLLQSMRESALPSLLPVAGVSGTLEHRMRGTLAEGRIRAKTGTMTGVSALSGYADAVDSDVGQLTFSLIANSAPVSASGLRDAQDEIMVAITSARVCK
jgi:D-alanyl-D-alanine carboxypeptidase/D-alanyl-D-alanine-endopeptidase (penicillin-binding protein 4)